MIEKTADIIVNLQEEKEEENVIIESIKDTSEDEGYYDMKAVIDNK